MKRNTSGRSGDPAFPGLGASFRRSLSVHGPLGSHHFRPRILLISVLTVIASGCSGGPAAPTRATAPIAAQSTRGNLTMPSMALNDAGQGAHGDWLYKITVQLSETGGVATTVTSIQFQALVASRILATETVVPDLTLSANSSSDEAVEFSADTHVGDLSAVTVNMTVEFTDANGNSGSVSNSFTCFGCFDYLKR